MEADKKKIQDILLNHIKRDYASLRGTARRPAQTGPVSIDQNDLDAVDEVASELLHDFADRKLHMLRQLEDCYDHIKSAFLAVLDRLSDRVRDLIDRSSKWSLLESAISEFFDKKNDFEEQDTPERMGRVSDCLRRLFELEEFAFFGGLLDSASLQVLLGEMQSQFLKIDRESGDLREFEVRLVQQSISQEELPQLVDIGRLQLSTEDSPEPAGSVWGAFPSIDKVRQKFTRFAKPTISQRTELTDRILRSLQDTHLKRKYKKATPLPKNSQLVLFEVRNSDRGTAQSKPCVTLRNYAAARQNQARPGVDDEESSKSFELVDISRNAECLSRFKVIDQWFRYSIAPSDRFIVFDMKKERNWLLCEFVDGFRSIEAVPLESLGGRLIMSFVFVDHARGDKLAFIDQHSRLVVFDLAARRVEFELAESAVEAVHYVDQNHLLLIRNTFDVGLFSVDGNEVINWVQHDASPGSAGRPGKPFDADFCPFGAI